MNGGYFVLNEGWLYKEGLSKEWITPDFDDADWKQIDPTADIKNLGLLNHERPLTLRLNFRLDHDNSDSLFICIMQAVASKVYIDGQLVAIFGDGVEDGKPVKAINPLNRPVKIKVEAGKQHTLVVQCEFQRMTYLIHHGAFQFLFPLFRGIIANENNAFELFLNRSIEYQIMFRTGLLFFLFLIHFIGYLFYPAYRVQLLYSIYSIPLILQSSSLIVGWTVDTVEYAVWLPLLLHLFDALSFIMLLVVSTNLLKGVRIIQIMAVVPIIVNSVFSYYLIQKFGLIWITTLLFLPLYIAWLTQNQLKQNNDAARFILFGSIAFAVFFLPFLILVRYTDSPLPYNSSFIPDLFFNLAVLSYPIALSMAVSQNFRSINLNLLRQMEDNRRLANEKEEILTNQKSELEKQVSERTEELQSSLENLQATQSQLIQSEKMASLGQLTAGIAHEIQNPLNFVNNFSDVSGELIDEMNESLEKGNVAEAKKLSSDVKENLKKISHHGRRADAIVKGMLQHSRTSSGVKELISINNLADEYLRLAYHGLRAKDKSFNATIKTEFDPDIETVNVIPQDIGRVILNLITNAFYAVSEKQKSTDSGYVPTVIVSTKKTGDKINVTVSDNGVGIPDDIIDKIFQPFFTTKPVGEGTGLGLSLAYDIVQAHGGELKVKTDLKEGSAFIVILPLK